MDASSINPTEEESAEEFDPARRRLCPDGACVGVIGADERCGVCGRTEAEAAAGAEPAPAFEHGGDANALEQRGVPDSGGDAVGFDPTRRLCDDGSCVGVVGDDGVCRTCGRRSQ